MPLRSCKKSKKVATDVKSIQFYLPGPLNLQRTKRNRSQELYEEMKSGDWTLHEETKCVSEQKYKRKVESRFKTIRNFRKEKGIQPLLEVNWDTDNRSTMGSHVLELFWPFIMAGTSFRSSGDEVNWLRNALLYHNGLPWLVHFDLLLNREKNNRYL